MRIKIGTYNLGQIEQYKTMITNTRLFGRSLIWILTNNIDTQGNLVQEFFLLSASTRATQYYKKCPQDAHDTLETSLVHRALCYGITILP